MMSVQRATALAASLLVFMSLQSTANAAVVQISCFGNQAGTLNVNSVNGGMTAFFSTAASSGSLQQAAAICPSDHFNWLQNVTRDTNPFRPVDSTGAALNPVFRDPPLGGFGNAPGTLGDDTQWADNLAFYWDEGNDPRGLNLSAHILGAGQGTILEYRDFPGSPFKNAILEFSTYLVGVNAAGNISLPLARFTWRFTNNPNPNATLLSYRRDALPSDEAPGYTELLSLEAFSIPEPNSLALTAMGLLIFGYRQRKNKSQIASLNQPCIFRET